MTEGMKGNRIRVARRAEVGTRRSLFFEPQDVSAGAAVAVKVVGQVGSWGGEGQIDVKGFPTLETDGPGAGTCEGMAGIERRSLGWERNADSASLMGV